MKKSLFGRIIIALLIPVLVLCLFACKKPIDPIVPDDDNDPPPVSYGTYFMDSVGHAITTVQSLAKDLEKNGLLGCDMRSHIDLTKGGVTDRYLLNVRGNMNLFANADGAYSNTNGFNVDIGKNDSALMSIVYENNKMYLNLDGKKVDLGFFNIAEAIGGKGEIFPETSKDDIFEKILTKITGVGGLVDSFLATSGNSYDAKNNITTITFTPGIVYMISSVLLSMIDDKMLTSDTSVQEMLDGVMKNLNADGDNYYFDAMGSKYSSKYIHHLTFDTAEKTQKAIKSFNELKEAGGKKWEECVFYADPNDSKSIFTDIKVNDQGEIDYNPKYMLPKSVSPLYGAAEKDKLFPQTEISATIDLDANNVLEGLSLNFKLPKQSIQLKNIEKVEYGNVIGAEGKRSRTRVIYYAANFDGTAKKAKTFDIDAFDMSIGATIKFDKTIQSTPLTDEEKLQYADSNLLNAKSNGTFNMKTTAGVTENYQYNLNANIDPLVFVDGNIAINPIDIKYNIDTLENKKLLIGQLKTALMKVGYLDFTITQIIGDKSQPYARVFFNPEETTTTNLYITFRGKQYTLDILKLIDDVIMDEKNGYLPITPPSATTFANIPLGDLDIFNGEGLVSINKEIMNALKTFMKLLNKEYKQESVDIWNFLVLALAENVLVDQTAKDVTILPGLFDKLVSADSAITNEAAKNAIKYIKGLIFEDGKYSEIIITDLDFEIFGASAKKVIDKTELDSYVNATALTYLENIKPILKPTAPTV